ncbi:MAG: Ig-like domain-containing protein [Lachnospiraceae bacterium]|nr:Ig-like domain-containing protein [Lachnospiraceae bacterium]
MKKLNCKKAAAFIMALLLIFQTLSGTVLAGEETLSANVPDMPETVSEPDICLPETAAGSDQDETEAAPAPGTAETVSAPDPGTAETVSSPDPVMNGEAADITSGDVSEMLFQEGGSPDQAKIAESSVMALHKRDGYEGACDVIAEAVGDWNGDRQIGADLSQFDIPKDEVSRLLADVINQHPEFFYLDGSYTCSIDPSGKVKSIFVGIRDGYTIAESEEFDRKVTEILRGIDRSWTDLQKTIYIHDYLVTHVQYDLSMSRYSAEDAIVRGSCVCMGYSLAFEYLMNRVADRFNCTYVRSGCLNHAWNYLTIGGKQYYVDCTWDDPISGSGHFYEYHCEHADFLMSRDKLHENHNTSDWTDYYGNDVYNSVRGAKDYENAPWVKMNSPIPMIGNTGGCFGDNEYGDVQFYTYDFKTGEKNKLTEYEAKTAWNGSNWWMSSFSSLSCVGNYFTATTATDILLINSKTGSKRTIYTLTDAEKAKGFIFGAQVRDGIMTYQLYATYGSGKKGSGKIDLSAYDNKGVAVILEQKDIDLDIGGTATIKAEVLPEELENKKVIFKSVDDTIARVDSTGLVTGVSEGDTAIEVTAEEGGKSAFCRINVEKKTSLPVYTVTFDNKGVTVYTEQVTQGEVVKKVPDDPAGVFAGWYHDGNLWNRAIPVTGNMKITAGFAPSAMPDDSGSAMDTVLSSKNGSTLYLTKGQTYSLDVNYRWTSEDPKTAQIIKKNKIKAKKETEGIAITGTPVTGEGSDITCNVYICAPVFEKKAAVLVGETAEIPLDTKAMKAHYSVAWFSSNPSIALVEGGKVYGCSKGSCRVTAYVNGKAFNSTVNVVEKKSIDPVEDTLVLQPFQNAALRFADGFSLKKVKWSCSLPLNNVINNGKVIACQNAVVRIGTDGKIKAVGKGRVKLTATTVDGTKTITVKPAVPPVRTFFVPAGKNRAFTLMGADPQKIAWSSDDESVATVKNGKVKAGTVCGMTKLSGNYSTDKNGKGFDYTLRVYSEDPTLRLTGSGELNCMNKAGTVYELNVRAGDICHIGYEKDTLFEPVLFAGNNSSIAFIDEAGTVYARKTGKTKITAKAAGKNYTIKVTVAE